MLQDCRGWSTSSGSWFGIITVLIIIALTTLTVSTPNHIDLTRNLWKCIILLAEEAVLSLFGILFVVMAFYQTRRLKFSIATRQSRVDEFLLYTAFFFAANYTITTIILAADFEAKGRSTSNMSDAERHLLIGRCLVNAFEFIQMVLQTYFVQDSFYRCSDRIEQQIVKPGRQSIVALLGINLALWIQKSFQLKNADILFMLETNRGTYGWILFVVTMPISLFYRYHCTVCLSQCFNKLYEDETQRFEEMWRHQVDPFTDILVRSTDSLCDFEHDEKHLKETNEVQVTVENEDKQNRRLAAFSKTKPWRTFDLTDESDGDNKTTIPSLNHQAYNNLQTIRGGGDTGANTDNLDCDDENLSTPPKERTPNFEDQNQGNHKGNTTKAEHTYNQEGLKFKSTERHPSETNQTILQKGNENINKDNLGLERNMYNVLSSRRYSLVILPSCQHSDKNEELNAVTVDSQTFDKNLQEQLSSARQNPERRQIRRRRTLKNLETAKHRVLAAELAHRMVIERTSGASPTAFSNDANSTLLDSSSQFSPSRPSDATDNSPKITSVHGPTREFRIAKAVSETAAITIAPVESKIAANIPLITFSECSEAQNKDKDSSPKRHLSVLHFHHRRSAANINRVSGDLKAENEFEKNSFKRCSFKETSWPSRIGFRKAPKNYITGSSTPHSNYSYKSSKFGDSSSAENTRKNSKPTKSEVYSVSKTLSDVVLPYVSCLFICSLFFDLT
ncbi:unnamed protein product [Heterobilharzia americana]|nr:unnamed protein product [Heterobilharzia americana]